MLRSALIVVIPLAAIAVAGISSAPAAAPPDAPPPRDEQALWTVTMKSSSDPRPRTERVCLNDSAQRAELWTCAGAVRAPDTFEPGAQTVSCTNQLGKQTRSVIVSNNARVIRDRTAYETDVSIRRAGDDSWAESTMTYQGACPVPLTDEQPFVVIKPDGKVVDPFPTTACMVDVLKTVDGVTAPKAGYAWDPEGGPVPFVRYTYPSRHDHRATDITFTASGDLLSNGRFVFGTEMSGLFSPADKGPDTFGAEKIMPLWKDRCGVEADISHP